MSLNHKTKTSFGSDDGQGIDTDYFSDPSNTLGLDAIDRGSSSAPKGLFVIGDAGTGSAGKSGRAPRPSLLQWIFD